MKKLTVEQAISDIVDYNTLPSQIDFRDPWRMKSIEAEEFLDTLSENEKSSAFLKIQEKIDKYYTPVDGLGFSPAEMDEMF